MQRENAGKKGRKRVALPKMFQRGAQGLYYFRRSLSGKDTWVSLGTSDPDEARKALLKVVNSHTAVEALSKVEQSAQKLAEVFVESVTGKKAESLPLAEAQAKWVATTPEHDDIGATTKSFYESIFKKFVEWANAQGIADCGQVTQEHAKLYAKSLWEADLSGRTYNGHLKHLSRVFSAIDAITPLPNRNPFDRRIVPRKRKNSLGTIQHEALEPKQLESVLKTAAEHGRDWRDFFILGANTGLRLKDAALLEWKSIGTSFIELTPYKTTKTGSKARVPISPNLKIIIEERRLEGKSRYLIPAIAEHYEKNSDFITKQAKSIFDEALGKDLTGSKPSKHRKRTASVFSFHSFRTTFMSLLAQRDVSARDAMRIMGWESPEMIQVYERELERAKGDADSRALKLINAMDELKTELPAPNAQPGPLRPNAKQLKQLVEKYSNVTIGRIYGVSEMAVRKWLDKYAITRKRRIQSDITDENELAKIREAIHPNGK